MKSFLNKRTLVEYQRLMYNLCHLYYSWAVSAGSSDKLFSDRFFSSRPVCPRISFARTSSQLFYL